ncbi:MAG TPA: hypothetical protein VNA65_00690 [Candidatus Dormibacteraeota bacterium]|nr:hypothetical protein [Candidatus Dormibacteraeota bacterium]
MSEQQDELELEALARKLDDAFLTTRPRPGFEDELWTKVQARRPFGLRLRDALAGLASGIREVPAVPLAGLAALVVVILGIGLVGYVGGQRQGGAATAPAQHFSSTSGEVEQAPGFGRLPSPSLKSSPGGAATTAPVAVGPVMANSEYSGPVQLTWSGQNITLGSASVFRYREPTTTDADQFASSLGAALRGRPKGYLGSYTATDYTLEVRGTVQSSAQSPAYFIYTSPSMPPLDAAGAAPADLASLFLAAHSLSPQWNYTTAIDSSGELTRVVFERQFDAADYGPAYLVDANGQRYGMEVDLQGNHVEHVSGVLPVSQDAAIYKLVSSDVAFREATSSAPPPQSLSTPAPAVQLTKVELAYLLVPAGDHSYYEPVYVFSGSFQVNGTTYTKHLVAPAVDPSQRTP